MLKWSLISFGPLTILGPNNLVHKKFGPCLKMPYKISRGPNFIGPNFLEPKKVRGPKKIRDHFRTSQLTLNHLSVVTKLSEWDSITVLNCCLKMSCPNFQFHWGLPPLVMKWRGYCFGIVLKDVSKDRLLLVQSTFYNCNIQV